MAFERVFTMTDFHDGPRGGIAEFDGHPYLYECEWNDSTDDYASTFRLSPVTPEVLALALEDWTIWERWWTAFEDGRTTQETHPALPEDRARHDELESLLRERLQIDPANCTRVLGEFRAAANWDKKGLAPLEVRWERCGGPDRPKSSFATFWQRFAALCIDLVILLPLGLIRIWLESASKGAAFVFAVVYPVLGAWYVIYCHGRFGRTVGKWVVGIRVVRTTRERIGWREAWLRSSVDVVLMALEAVGSVVALATIANSEYYGFAWDQRAHHVAAHQPVWAAWASAVYGIWGWSEVVTMLFNKRRRALHDFIAGTVVISDRRS